MTNTNKFKIYKKNLAYSYVFGAYGVMEMVKKRPKSVLGIYVNSKARNLEALGKVCREKGFAIITDDTLFNKMNIKENIYVIGVFEKFVSPVVPAHNHIVLVHPMDMGNLGTTIRTAAGFHFCDVALIAPCADQFHPKTVRASMGSVFSSNVECFSSFEHYRLKNPGRSFYPFMLDGKVRLDCLREVEDTPFSLVFGNEATGLSESYLNIGCAVKIPQSGHVDSLNVSIAVGIAAYHFAYKVKKL